MFARIPAHFVIAVALCLSIGWGIRGNFGHETGAMIPGALAAMGAVALSGREDWMRKIGSFAFFGAVGWSFGGSISYMQVIAYTHSGHSASVLYGFACLFVIGFLWAIFGGIGTALPALVPRAQLATLYPVAITVFVAWFLQDYVVGKLISVDSAFRQRDPLYWYDTDWLGIIVAMGAALAYAAFRRGFDFGTSLVIHLCVGWWVGFLVLVVAFDWRMTPPRGDNWAGCLGMFGGLTIFLLRRNLRQLLFCGLLAGVIGGAGFALADGLKLLGIYSGWVTNWHSLLEQSYGFINGLGIAVIMLLLQRHAPDPDDNAPGPPAPWLELFSAVFVLVGITFLNLRKNPGTWMKASTVPPQMYGISTENWFNLAYLLIGALVILVLLQHRRRPIALLQGSPLARAQIFFLVFLWWIVAGNFERALAGFAPQRLVTEGVIFLNAIVCSALVLLSPPLARAENSASTTTALPRLCFAGLGVFALTSLLCWGTIRFVYGNTQAPYASRHIRFGPEATATHQKPSANQPHP